MTNNEIHNPLGRHLLVELWGVKTIEDVKEWETILFDAALASKSNPLKVALHKFEPMGVTGAIVLEESHITFHSWPEVEYIALDIFTCGKHTDPQAGLDYLIKILEPKKIHSKLVIRGKNNE